MAPPGPAQARKALVAITRPVEQAGALAARLESAGFDVLLAPAIRRLPPADWSELDEGIAGLRRGSYDGALFTSPAAVAAFAARLAGLDEIESIDALLAPGDALPSGPGPAHSPGASFFRAVREAVKPPAVHVGAVGVGTAAALELLGMPAAIVSVDGTGAGLVQALLDELGPGTLPGKRFLLPRAEEGRHEVPTGLGRHGARVDVATAYRTRRATPAQLAPLAGALPRLAAAVYASPSAVEACFAALPGLRAVAAVAIGSTTAAALEAAGARSVHVATRPDDEALLQAVRAANG